MYKHHEESLRTMVRHFREQKGVIAFIFGGSVAKGMERADSDLDGMAVVSQEEFEYWEKHNALTEVIQGKCTYEGWYFDVKYMTKDFLKMAAQKGSEHTRNSFTAQGSCSVTIRKFLGWSRRLRFFRKRRCLIKYYRFTVISC